MFGSETLDVAIGLVLVFLLLSLLLTAVTEIIESSLKTRAADLERAIKLLLQDPHGANNQVVEAFYSHPLVFALFKGEYKSTKKSWFFGREMGGDLPSYIPRDLFSAVVLDLESAGSSGNGLAGVVESFRRLYGDDVATLKGHLESWYDGVMDRAAGWYKRRTQKMLFWLGLTLAIALNINPIVIGQHLSATPQARADMVELATRALADPNASRNPSDELRRLDAAVRQVGLPMGWGEFALSRTFPSDRFWAISFVLAVSGWLITAVCTTLGAPFWFDVLNKLMVIRATVKPKEKSRDEASEDRFRPDRNAAVKVLDAHGPATGVASAGVALTGTASAAGDSARGDEDGCLDGHEIPQGQETEDIDLPPATGGIVGRD